MHPGEGPSSSRVHLSTKDHPALQRHMPVARTSESASEAPFKESSSIDEAASRQTLVAPFHPDSGSLDPGLLISLCDLNEI